MGCALEFPESVVRVEFCGQGDKQKIIIDVLTKHSEMDINKLALALGVSVKKLRNICDGKNFLVGEQADSLLQLFLMFLSRQFFHKCTLIRSFMD
ncbi:Uncharacterised protein [Legionella lansingensis]|uniref:Uncharacterized protein n=1 Tax=Legionella lansingensis TaxID=45067 RepID=A0A0W0VH91_9GAMM|nr:hypothetical protein [Legionella lansingensis]KTD19536.1 hypothetical protein Llan_2078 [Legionella lansingensis]SNV44757.1 Uncharacterised protein [Legionella lansingensis]